MTKNIKIIVEYDGTGFFGWQRQKDKKSIQGEIEAVLSLILNQTIRISGSGRTDAGVHAYGQVANFSADTDMLPQDLKKAVNRLIKVPIVIRGCSLTNKDFHSQYNAISKEYQYVILNTQDPCAIGRQYLWHIRDPLDIEIMNQCCDIISGTHDFKSFENTGSPRSSTVRKVLWAHVSEPDNNRVVFNICASGFLKYMVRNLIGTIVLAGKHKISVEAFKAILLAKDRTLAGPTAPAQGLFLKQVNYS